MELINLTIDSTGNFYAAINIVPIMISVLIIIAIILVYMHQMNKRPSAKLDKISVNLPFGIGTVDLLPDMAAQNAAWALYIELITRIAVQELKPEEGLLREALSSLYSLFPTTRQILKDAGPSAGISEKSVGGIAIAVLNRGLRPFLAHWHPLLQEWEAKRIDKVSPKEHEKNWPDEQKLRSEVEHLRKELDLYSKALAEIAKIR